MCNSLVAFLYYNIFTTMWITITAYLNIKIWQKVQKGGCKKSAERINYINQGVPIGSIPTRIPKKLSKNINYKIFFVLCYEQISPLAVPMYAFGQAKQDWSLVFVRFVRSAFFPIPWKKAVKNLAFFTAPWFRCTFLN